MNVAALAALKEHMARESANGNVLTAILAGRGACDLRIPRECHHSVLYHMKWCPIDAAHCRVPVVSGVGILLSQSTLSLEMGIAVRVTGWRTGTIYLAQSIKYANGLRVLDLAPCAIFPRIVP